MRPLHKISTIMLGLLAIATALLVSNQPGNSNSMITSAAAQDITIRTEMGQKTYLAQRGQKTYLRVDLEGVRHEETERPPVNIAIVIDKSGSMSGSKLEQAKEAAIMAVERLGSNDYVSIVAYSDQVEVLIPPSQVTNHTEFRHRIRELRSGGQTALYAGTKRGIHELEEFLDANRVNRVILLSDGMANVGPSSPSELEALGRMAGKKGISITTIGIGLGFNEDLMTKLAYASDGNHAFVKNERDLVDIFNKEFGDVLSVVAQDVEIIIECEDGFRPIRILGRTATIEGQKIRLKMNQLYSAQEKQLIIEAEIEKELQEGPRPFAKVTIDYRSMADKSRMKLKGAAEANFTKSKSLAEGTINKRVMSSVVEQIATERNEEAVTLRDKGMVEKAKKVLQENAAYLTREAENLGGSYAPELNKLADKNKADSENLDDQKWTASRKEMKARQYKQKTQQSY